jgi:hypothetical protein
MPTISNPDRVLCGYLTISAFFPREPVPAFSPRKLAPVQSFVQMLRHIPAGKTLTWGTGEVPMLHQRIGPAPRKITKGALERRFRGRSLLICRT